MRNPLMKRLPKELLGDFKKYMIMFLFLILMIAMGAGDLVASFSMNKSFDETKEKYNLEDGNFKLYYEASDEFIENMNKKGIKVYDNLYKELDEFVDDDEKADATVRVFKNRKEINKVCVMEGRLPENEDEISIDRLHADYKKIKVGDTIGVDGKKLKVVGFVALPDYNCLFQNNDEMMFDADMFNIAIVSDEFFDNDKHKVYYNYSWIYDKMPKNEKEEKKVSDELLEDIIQEAMATENSVDGFVPAYQNQAINFAKDDVGKDSVFVKYILYVFIAVIAFIFAITINNTIEKEAAVIGTLRASGYTRMEMLVHYMTIPVIVTLIGAVIGNILGYTVMKDAIADLYYNSYSLPTFETLWNQDAFILTTVVPVVLMIVINLFMISKKLRLSPLKFLRHDLSTTKKKKAMRLPRISFFGRFRLRIILQNMISYLILVFGIFLAGVMMFFCAAAPITIDHYQENVEEQLLAPYQYMLKQNVDMEGNVITTSNKDAKRVCMESLITSNKYKEEIAIYAIDDKKFENLKDNEVLISTYYEDKYDVKEGDELKLERKYEDGKFTFKCSGVYEKGTGISIYMSEKQFKKIFEKDEEFFNGYMSDSKITDIDENYIYKTITYDDVVKTARQLNHSMGNFMDIFAGFCFVLAMLLMYLLTKIVIEKNEVSISMVKVLGYDNGEINRLYMLSTTIVVVFGVVLSMILSHILMAVIWKAYLLSMPGWMPYYMPVLNIVEVGLVLFAAYIVVAIFDMRRIKKIPLTSALKNVE